MSETDNPMPPAPPAAPAAPAAPAQPQPPVMTQEEYIRAQIAIGIAAMRPEPRPLELKVGHPKAYNGDPAKAKQWITSVLTYITLNLTT